MGVKSAASGHRSGRIRTYDTMTVLVHQARISCIVVVYYTFMSGYKFCSRRMGAVIMLLTIRISPSAVVSHQIFNGRYYHWLKNDYAALIYALLPFAEFEG